MAGDFLAGLEDEGEAEVFDDGEEAGDVYVFLLTGADEDRLLSAASRLAALPLDPAG